MPTRILIALAVVVAAMVTTTGPASAQTPGGLQLTGQVQLDARLSELTFTTPALADPVKVRVLVPSDAAAHPDWRFPALYLLHGSDADQTAWTDQMYAEDLTEGLGVVVVMPDGGADGWYTNWPGGRQPRWEDFHINQLIPWIDAHEPVIAARGKRAIAGVSMGGFGAMSYAARHPDLFVAAASFSGAVDLGTPAGIAPSITDAMPWGPWSASGLGWRGHNPADLAANLRGINLSIYTGNGQPGGALDGGGGDGQIEPVVEAESASLANRLAALGIPRLFDDYGPGDHSAAYWRRDLTETLPGLMDVFAHPPDLPSPFSFTATEQSFTIRGYTVRAARDALAFRTLANVRLAGFAYTGDGPATVTTARRYAHRARYRVRIRTDGRPVSSKVQRSTAGGRLTITVPAGGSVGITRATAAS
jgi:S-formylglutathione hydrolase FrmB